MALTFRDNNGSPLSFTQMDSNFRYFTGSFENSGSITAASFTSSGNISASGNLFCDRIAVDSYITTPSIYSNATDVVKINDNLQVFGQITASGNVSSSGTYLGQKLEIRGLGGGTSAGFIADSSGAGDMKFGIGTDSPTEVLDVAGGIKASMDLSARNATFSGDVSSSGMFRGDQLFLNSGSSQYLNTPAEGDAALIAMSSSGAFSSTAALTPNNIALFTEYKTNDTAILNGKAASSILLTVNHGASNNKNSVAQIASVVKEFNSNDTHLVFSTRGDDDVIRERVRVGDGTTSITGSLVTSATSSAAYFVGDGSQLTNLQRPISSSVSINVTASNLNAGYYFRAGGNITCSIQSSSLVSCNVGNEFEFFQTSSAGYILFETGSGVTLNSKDAKLKLAGQFSAATLKKVGSNPDTWDLIGDLG